MNIEENQILSIRAVRQLLGVGTTTLWRMRQRGDLPEPVAIGPRRKGWRAKDMLAWLEARAQEANA